MNLKESKGWENGRNWREEKGENDVIILKSKKIKRNKKKEMNERGFGISKSIMKDTETWEYGDNRGSVLPGLGWVFLLSVLLDHCSFFAHPRDSKSSKQ